MFSDLPQFRADSSSPPPVNGGGAAAPTPYLAPVASAVADAAGRADQAAAANLAPMRDRVAAARAYAGQGDYAGAAGAGLGALAAGAGGVGLTAVETAAAPFIAAAKIGSHVAGGLLGSPYTPPAVAAPAAPAGSAAAATMPAPVGPSAPVVGGVPVTPAAQLTDKGVATAMSQPGAGTVGTGTTPNPSAAHSFFGGLPLYQAQAYADLMTKGKASMSDPIGNLVESAYTDHQKTMAAFDAASQNAGAQKLAEIDAKRATETKNYLDSMRGLAGLKKIGVEGKAD